jgi:hypothetical protein
MQFVVSTHITYTYGLRDLACKQWCIHSYMYVYGCITASQPVHSLRLHRQRSECGSVRHASDQTAHCDVTLLGAGLQYNPRCSAEHCSQQMVYDGDASSLGKNPGHAVAGINTSASYTATYTECVRFARPSTFVTRVTVPFWCWTLHIISTQDRTCVQTSMRLSPYFVYWWWLNECRGDVSVSCVCVCVCVCADRRLAFVRGGGVRRIFALSWFHIHPTDCGTSPR